MKLLLTFVLVLLFISCERTVEFDVKETSPKLVIEGTIENGQPPIVRLSKSIDYYSVLDLNSLMNSFVHNAEIYVSNGTLTHKLKEYAEPIAPGINFYYYSIDSSNLATAFTGQLNNSYSLRVISEGKEYNANTSIPNTTRRIDSVYWKAAPPGNPPNKIMLMLKATDPPGFGDYVRYFTKRNQEPFYPGVNSVFDDQVIDGTTYVVQVERGVDRNLPTLEGFTFFDRGDTITLKISNIDKVTYDFWRTMEFSYASVGNPFSSPIKVLGNISNNALGYFGGYASQFRTIIVPQ
jgi:hypothetical protein